MPNIFENYTFMSGASEQEIFDAGVKNATQFLDACSQLEGLERTAIIGMLAMAINIGTMAFLMSLPPGCSRASSTRRSCKTACRKGLSLRLHRHGRPCVRMVPFLKLCASRSSAESGFRAVSALDSLSFKNYNHIQAICSRNVSPAHFPAIGRRSPL